MTIIYAVLMFAVLIFIHELGHFVAAKLCKVKVNDFSIGMGPSIFKRKKGETTYHIKALPIGGFCAMEGEDEDSEEEGAFNKKTPGQKAFIVVAGAAMNLILAILLMTIVIFISGKATTTLEAVKPGSPAELAGLKAGDKIVAVENKKIEEWSQFVQEIGIRSSKLSKYDKIDVTVDRKGKEITVKIGFIKEKNGRFVIGVEAKRYKSFGYSLIEGPKATWNMTKNMFDVIKRLFTGGVSVKQLSGPVGIIYMVDKSAEQGVVVFLYLMALISLNLAIFNMLPFPALDGGRLLFIVLRVFIGDKLSSKVEGVVHAVGMMLLLALTLYVTWNDIIRFIIPIFK